MFHKICDHCILIYYASSTAYLIIAVFFEMRVKKKSFHFYFARHFDCKSIYFLIVLILLDVSLHWFVFSINLETWLKKDK